MTLVMHASDIDWPALLSKYAIDPRYGLSLPPVAGIYETAHMAEIRRLQDEARALQKAADAKALEDEIADREDMLELEPEEEDEWVICEACSKRVKEAEAISWRDAWGCQACQAVYEAGREACDHRWEAQADPDWPDDPGIWCGRCGTWFPEDVGAESYPLICDGWENSL